MDQRIGMERKMRRLSAAVTLAATGALALIGCSSDEAVPPTTTAETSTTTTVAAGEHTLVFDDLDGGSSVIMVYPGATYAPADRKFNGTYNRGDTVTAECKTTGREVNSVPEVGEQDRSSDQWVRIDGTSGETQFATAVYIENPDQLLSQLPVCQP